MSRSRGGAIGIATPSSGWFRMFPLEHFRQIQVLQQTSLRRFEDSFLLRKRNRRFPQLLCVHMSRTRIHHFW